MAEPALRRMTLHEFLRWEDGTDTRYELIGGFVIAMAPPMPRHGRLATALGAELRAALRGRLPCGVYSEAGIALADESDTCYVADIAVSCEPLQADDRLLRGPILIVEVLSPSTAASDRQIKVPDYRRIPSVEEILLIDSDSIFAEVLSRDGDRWITEIVRGSDAMLNLASVPATLSMAQLYEGIALPDPQPRRAIFGG